MIPCVSYSVSGIQGIAGVGCRQHHFVSLGVAETRTPPKAEGTNCVVPIDFRLRPDGIALPILRWRPSRIVSSLYTRRDSETQSAETSRDPLIIVSRRSGDATCAVLRRCLPDYRRDPPKARKPEVKHSSCRSALPNKISKRFVGQSVGVRKACVPRLRRRRPRFLIAIIVEHTSHASRFRAADRRQATERMTSLRGTCGAAHLAPGTGGGAAPKCRRTDIAEPAKRK